MKGYIYTIRSYQTKDIYIGSTRDKLCNRMAKHRFSYKQFINGNYDYTTSFDIIQFEDAYIEILEELEYNSKEELKQKEGNYIRNMECINKHIAGRTKQNWYEDNKERILEERKKYYEDHKENIKEKQKKYRNKNKLL
jgi:hypothetical protein